MDVIIKNCNNIDEANISIKENFLNIKFAANGTGKSTISKAISLNAVTPDKLGTLTPFKVLNDTDAVNEVAPIVLGTDQISTVATFDNSYIENCPSSDKLEQVSL